MPDRPSLYDPLVSPAALLIWLCFGSAFAAVWFALTEGWPPIWARLVGGMVLFAVVIPLEAALARRHHRRRRGGVTHRKEIV